MPRRLACVGCAGPPRPCAPLTTGCLVRTAHPTSPHPTSQSRRNNNSETQHTRSHSCTTLICGSRSSCSWVKAWNSFCHCDGASTLLICTAVTLYSGQLVAQSELSVVITLAPDSGWWKVV